MSIIERLALNKITEKDLQDLIIAQAAEDCRGWTRIRPLGEAKSGQCSGVASAA